MRFRFTTTLAADDAPNRGTKAFLILFSWAICSLQDLFLRPPHQTISYLPLTLPEQRLSDILNIFVAITFATGALQSKAIKMSRGILLAIFRWLHVLFRDNHHGPRIPLTVDLLCLLESVFLFSFLSVVRITLSASIYVKIYILMYPTVRNDRMKSNLGQFKFLDAISSSSWFRTTVIYSIPPFHATWIREQHIRLHDYTPQVWLAFCHETLYEFLLNSTAPCPPRFSITDERPSALVPGIRLKMFTLFQSAKFHRSPTTCISLFFFFV